MNKTKEIFTEEQKISIAAAQVLGTAAFANGIKSAPCLDKNVMALVEKYSTTDWSLSHVVCAIMKAWSTGWHNANLCGDVQ